MNKYTITTEYEGQRLDAFLCAVLGDVTRSQIKKHIEAGKVFLCRGRTSLRPVKKAGEPLKVGDIVEVGEFESNELSFEAEDIKLDVVYEDEHLVVINKPIGMVVHPAVGNKSGTLVNALVYKFSLSEGTAAERPGIVHRLDKDTCGLMVVAKTNSAHEKLAKQFEPAFAGEKAAKREYIALLEGVVKEDKKTIETKIARNEKDRKAMAAFPKEGIKGKLAISEMQVVERFKNHTLTRWQLKTGRTHQIRVHAKHINHPVVGDETYGLKKQVLMKGQFLVAAKLSFLHPMTNERLTFEISMPSEFKALLKKL
ncbi:MAG: RluA family pseudouridine synthase [Firmicutes bacterium]|nr:RluA family pseudouridine synthase [Bacillota bacterium]MCL2770976.1 RluA family pseudouridine synthase [Bacillota bacterium]